MIGEVLMRMIIVGVATVAALAGCRGTAKTDAPEPGQTSLEAPAAPASTVEPAEVVLHIDGMVCQGCAAAAGSCLREVDGVTAVDVSFQDGTARVRYDLARTGPEGLASALHAVDRGAAPRFQVTSVEGLR